MTFLVSSLLAIALLGEHLATAAPTSNTTQACQAIDSALPGQLSWPLSLGYIDETQEYWSTALRDLSPACVVRPINSAAVATAVQIINQYPDVPFAAKSGGHDPNPGHGSIQDGILIAMREITGATYNADTGLAYVKPGGTWADVISALEPSGYTVAGGRLGIVGVGGYLLQGGISFLSAQLGLAADNIVAWEIVVPNGTVVNITAAERPDLAVALRGSGSQFGIVTQFTIDPHPIAQVWGGLRVYPNTSRDALVTAFHNFVANNAGDPKTAIIFTDILATESLPIIIVYYFYDGAALPDESILDEFLGIPYLLDQTSTQTYSSLLTKNGDEAALLNARNSFRTFTLPYIANDSSLLNQVHEYWSSIVGTYLDNLLHLTAQCSIDFQPVPSIVGKQSQAKGGNAIGLTASDPDRIFLELQCSWASALDDATVYNLTREVTAWLETKIPEWNTQAGLSENAYLPLFMNDAMADQNVTGSYSAYGTLKALQREIDPQGLFSTRAGGFKY